MTDQTASIHEIIRTYTEEIKRKFYSGIALEHAYRPALQQLIESLCPGVNAINDAKRVEVGAPDFVLTAEKKEPQQLELVRSVPLGFVETKDLKPGILDKKENKAQLERYMDLGNVVHTDGLLFRFYFERELVKEVSLGSIDQHGRIVIDTQGNEDLDFYFKQTVSRAGRTIRTAKALALHMADRARPIRRTILKALQQDTENKEETELSSQYHAFKKTLIHDLEVQDFADIYAETIAYGLFAARYNDDTPGDFTLTEAASKIPQTNPFLRQFFLQIAAYEKDIRLDWVLNNFADLFSYADVHKIMSTYGRETGMNHDPVTHFYETFLGEYDSKRRKARGVYYTPRPVVQYIVRAVDTVLREEFGLPDGLADDSSTTYKLQVDYDARMDRRTKKQEYKEVTTPKVQILDPATGTSTFLNETVKLIAERKAGHLGSSWSDYVEKSLLPRLHGFELLMAAYSMAHMRLGLTLAESGYKPSRNPPRLGVYLTNALEEPAHHDNNLLGLLGFGRTLTEESNEADKVKRDLPIMVVMGNPPYSVSSANKGKHIDAMMKPYKQDLNERNIQPLSDDYIKFIRYAEGMIEKTGQGVVAMITNNSFIDGLIHRQMRKHLLHTFDKIWVLDLHGNAKKKETAPDGGKDENVFDIMQGVSIVIMSKTGRKHAGELAEVQFAELYGKRADKYAALQNEISFEPLQVLSPRHLFIQNNTALLEEYEQFISVRELMPFGDAGIKTHRDNFAIDCDKEVLLKRITDFVEGTLPPEELGLKDTRDFNIAQSRWRLAGQDLKSFIKTVAYRPFDNRSIFYSDAVADWPRHRTMSQIIDRENVALICTRSNRGLSQGYITITDQIADIHLLDSAADSMFVLPLFTYSGEYYQIPNINDLVCKKLFQNLPPFEIVGDKYDMHKADVKAIPAIDVLDYIYAVLHSPSYRQKYKEFLKTDFPRIPKPTDIEQFQRLVKLGKKLRELHLMHNVAPGSYSFKEEGDNTVQKLRYIPHATSSVVGTTGSGDYATGSVYINETQCFENVPEIAWNFYIGGYQPAQKWLKDRKARTLGYQDIEHYQKILKILLETHHIMQQIDTP